MQKPLVDQKFLLKKIPGKGGWTYAELPQVSPSKNAPFGWVIVQGSIDGFAIKKYHLMPFGDGKLFLPVKKEIRKVIGKKEGDYVHVILFPDQEPIEIPEELKICLQDLPAAETFFNALSQSEQSNYIQWIFSAKREQTKVDRLAQTIDRLLMGLKFYDKAKKELF